MLIVVNTLEMMNSYTICTALSLHINMNILHEAYLPRFYFELLLEKIV